VGNPAEETIRRPGQNSPDSPSLIQMLDMQGREVKREKWRERGCMRSISRSGSAGR
jgi:hypothetical protein